MPPRSYTINFTGDVMLGRFVDQLFPVHLDSPSEAQLLALFRYHQLHDYDASSPWGSMLPLLRSADLNIINLETAVTTHKVKWPGKEYDHGMHPENISALPAARIDYVSLANDHVLDYGVPGLEETIRTLRDANIPFAGVGDSATQAAAPAILTLPRPSKHPVDRLQSVKEHHVHVFSASDRPSDWSSIPQINLIDYTPETRQRLKAQLSHTPPNSPAPALKIFSIHWCPNHSWHPSEEIKSLAYFLIDECDIDIIHGHSSHHIQGAEVYQGKLILYGCGSFIDDYAVEQTFRNNLSALWRVTVEEDDDAKPTSRLKLIKLEFVANRIRQFQAGHLTGRNLEESVDLS